MQVFVRVALGSLTLRNSEVESLEVDQCLGEHTTCHLEFIRDSTVLDDLPLHDLLKEPVTVTVQEADQSPVEIFQGVIVDGRLCFQPGHGARFLLDAMSPSVRHQLRTTAYFPQSKLGDVAAKLGAKLVDKPPRDWPASDYVQWGETEFEFLRRLADEHGCFLVTTGAAVELRAQFLTKNWVLGWDELLEVTARATPLNHGVTGANYDPADKHTHAHAGVRKSPEVFSGAAPLLAAVAQIAKGFGSGGDHQLVEPHGRTVTHGDFKAVLRSESTRALGGAVLYDFVSPKPGMLAGDKVRLDVVGKGDFGLIRVQHQFREQHYTARCEGTVWSSFTNLQQPARPVHHGVVTAEVVDNQDPNKLGRVCVAYRWHTDPNKTNWARLAVPHSGNARGTMFIPEIGDEVLVAFASGDLERPYIVGCLWNGKDVPPEFGDQNNAKRIVTRSGNTLQFLDEDGKETVEIFTPEGKCLLQLTNNQGQPVISLYSEGDFSLEAKGEIRLKCKTLTQDVSADSVRKIGGDESADVGNTLTLKSGMDAGLAAGMNLTLKGMNVDSSAGMLNNLVGTLVQLQPSGSAPQVTAKPVTVPAFEVGDRKTPENAEPQRTADSGTPRTTSSAVAKAPTKGAPPSTPVKAAPKKGWVKIEFLDDLAAQPVGGVTTTVTTPDGSTGDFTTTPSGIIEIKEIDPGSIDANCSLNGAQLATTLAFMGQGKAPGGPKEPDDAPIAAGGYIVANIESHKVKKGETIASLAGTAGIGADDLAIFNFGTSDPDAVNAAVRVRVGSKTLDADKKTFLFDDADKPGVIYIPKEWKRAGLATEKTHSVRLRPIVPRWVAITTVDDHFAPSKENLEITYSTGGLSKKKVSLEIRSDHYTDGPIFMRELTAAESTDGEHTINWDGKANCTAGDLKGQYINPLYAPYKVRIYADATHTDEAEFKVLYHSVKIRKGPWTPDELEPPDASEKEWVRYKLNELGYWGGPVDQDLAEAGEANSYLKKAIIRYKANHKKLHELVYANYNDTITAELKAALKANDNRRSGFLEEAAFTDITAESKLRIEALTYEKSAEFGTPKPPYEKERLNRPLVPVEVDIFLKNKADAEMLAPEAVGACRINWRHTDENEDLAPQFANTAAEPSRTKKYVEDCLKLKGGRAGKGDNAHQDFGGVRDDAKDWITPWTVGKQYTPYETKEDAGQSVLYSMACVDNTKYPKRLGKAGAFFQPSRVSGDDYKLRAEIDFTSLPNRADLEKFHNVTDAASRIHADTGTFRIWRFNSIAVVVNWPARTNSEDWPKIHTEFQEAWLDIDTASIAYKTISDVITAKEYRTIVEAKTAHRHIWLFRPISLEDDSLVGVKLPKQGRQNAATYKAALKTFTNDDYWDKIYDPLREQLSKNLRKDHPSGFILVNFLTHKPVDIQKAPPGDKSITQANFVTWTFSIGLADSVIFADQKDPDKVYYVVSHEMGHNFWLQHWENAGPVLADHDNNDHNCSMAYSGSLYPHQAPGSYTPHFCGKCNLKLRGWDVNAAGIPASS